MAIHRAPHIHECFTVVGAKIKAFYAFSPISPKLSFWECLDKDGSESVKNNRRAILNAKLSSLGLCSTAAI